MSKFLINSLAVEYPELSLDWHPNKNLPLTAANVTFGSNKKIWWKCHICEYEWEAYISNRRKQYKHPNQKGTGCPNCAGRIINKNNSFSFYNAELIKEWHLNKNLPITPDIISVGNKNKYWWICSTCEHEWKTSAISRSHGSGCPLCSKFKNRR